MTRKLLFPEWGAFARNENGAGGLDIELLRVVPLVDGNADAIARIDEQKRIADRDIHESFLLKQSTRPLVTPLPEFIPDVVAELLEILAGNIGDQGTEGIVEPDDVAGD